MSKEERQRYQFVYGSNNTSLGHELRKRVRSLGIDIEVDSRAGGFIALSCTERDLESLSIDGVDVRLDKQFKPHSHYS